MLFAKMLLLWVPLCALLALNVSLSGAFTDSGMILKIVVALCLVWLYAKAHEYLLGSELRNLHASYMNKESPKDDGA